MFSIPGLRYSVYGIVSRDWFLEPDIQFLDPIPETGYLRNEIRSYLGSFRTHFLENRTRFTALLLTIFLRTGSRNFNFFLQSLHFSHQCSGKSLCKPNRIFVYHTVGSRPSFFCLLRSDSNKALNEKKIWRKFFCWKTLFWHYIDCVKNTHRCSQRVIQRSVK